MIKIKFGEVKNYIGENGYFKLRQRAYDLDEDIYNATITLKWEPIVVENPCVAYALNCYDSNGLTPQAGVLSRTNDVELIERIKKIHKEGYCVIDLISGEIIESSTNKDFNYEKLNSIYGNFYDYFTYERLLNNYISEDAIVKIFNEDDERYPLLLELTNNYDWKCENNLQLALDDYVRRLKNKSYEDLVEDFIFFEEEYFSGNYKVLKTINHFMPKASFMEKLNKAIVIQSNNKYNNFDEWLNDSKTSRKEDFEEFKKHYESIEFYTPPVVE